MFPGGSLGQEDWGAQRGHLEGAGPGGRGCTGLGGTQPNEADRKPGRPGQPGANGASGVAGKQGEYRLQIIGSFDAIVEKVKTIPNAQLYDALLTH